MFSIVNNHQAIKMTTYWATDEAQAGYCYLSQNAGALRLLVPEARNDLLSEIMTGKEVTIEASLTITGCFDIVFEDGTDAPFFIPLGQGLMDCKLWKTKSVPFTVWNESGLVQSFVAKIKI